MIEYHSLNRKQRSEGGCYKGKENEFMDDVNILVKEVLKSVQPCVTDCNRTHEENVKTLAAVNWLLTAFERTELRVEDRLLHYMINILWNMYDNICDEMASDELLICKYMETINTTFTVLSHLCHVPSDLLSLCVNNLQCIKRQKDYEFVDVNEERLFMFRLKIHCVFLDSCVEYLPNSEHGFDLAALIYKQLKLSEVEENTSDIELFCKLLTSNNENITALVLSCFIPRYLNIYLAHSDTDVLTKVYHQILANYDNEQYSLSRYFIILCYLSDFYLNQSHQCKNCLAWVKEEMFWINLYKGLTNSDQSVRKQALYIFKKSIKLVNSSELNIVCKQKDKTEHVCTGKDDVEQLVTVLENAAISENSASENDDNMLGEEHLPLFWWDNKYKAELNQFYEELILLIECVENTQVHLISPMLCNISSVVAQCTSPVADTKYINILWVMILYRLMLKHDNASIVKFALIDLLKIKTVSYKTKEILVQVLNLTMTGLNISSLFSKVDAETEPELVTKLKEYLQENFDDNFLKTFINLVYKTKWNPVSAFYVTYCLSTISSFPKSSILTVAELDLIKNFVNLSIKNFYMFLRSGVQSVLLQVIINLTNTSVVKLQVIANVLSVFKSHESLKRGKSIWSDVVQWIAKNYTKQNAEEFLLKHSECRSHCDAKSFSRMIVILHDAKLLDTSGKSKLSTTLSVFNNLLSCFENYDKRAYVDNNVCDKNIEILQNILEENRREYYSDEECNDLMAAMVNSFPYIIMFIFGCYKSCSDLTQYDKIPTYLSALKNILYIGKKYKLDVCEWITDMYMTLVHDVEENDKYFMQDYFAIRLLEVLIDGFEIVPCCLTQLQDHLLENVNKVGRKPGENPAKLSDNNEMIEVSCGRLNSEYIESKWKILGKLNSLCSNKRDELTNLLGYCPFLSIKETFNIMEEAIQVGDCNTLIPIMEMLEEIIAHETVHCLNEDLLNTLSPIIDGCWNLLLEFRKNEIFLEAGVQFINMLYQDAVIMVDNNFDILIKYSEAIFSLSNNSLSKTLVIQIFQASYPEFNVDEEFTIRRREFLYKFLVTPLVYGSVTRKDEKLLTDACSFYLTKTNIKSPTLVEIHEMVPDKEIRAKAITILVTIRQFSFNSDVFEYIDQLHLDLRKKVANNGKNNKDRYFGNTLTHRIKHRALQSLLVAEEMADEMSIYSDNDLEPSRFKWLCKMLLEENHQPSIRYQLEWLLTRMIIKYDKLDSLWDKLKEAQTTRIGGICSFISVIYHSIKYNPQEQSIDKAVTMILPYCMAHHYSIRLYSQVVSHKLLILAKEKSFDPITDKYKLVLDSLTQSIKDGQSIKNFTKLDNDFYFTVFDPKAHFSIQTVFVDLPRLSKVCDDEIIPLSMFIKCSIAYSKFMSPISFFSKDKSLANLEAASWKVRNESYEQVQTPAVFGEGQNAQKKMIPWKNLVPDYDELFSQFISGSSSKMNLNQEGLIVVASLVKKLANLGGLVRTCEVFGIKEFVISSLLDLKDQTFKSVSVTAEKWVHFTEVKPYYLKQYLLCMRKKGYSIVGAEQTVNSCLLQQQQFPAQCVLLLGDEQQGIPADLLPILDMCVEIPQLGIIRSLNVHVTGALFMWEYAKQHSLKPK